MKKKPVLVLWIMVFISILTLPFLGWKHFKRFLPGTLFMSILIALESIVAEKYKWWAIYKKIPPYFVNEFAFIIGPFFAGSLWILRLTYGRFYLYLLLNAVVDAIFVYPIYVLFKNMGIFELKKMNSHQLYGLFLIKALLMYGFQALWEKYVRKSSTKEPEQERPYTISPAE
ncbi:MAG: hypothetical protein U9Q88_14210 [Bacillota bacterium]|uniref:hypothetical protein n=1 Tax=Bacillus sp. RO2 TaxID=2723913 RepID=UPI00145DBFF9|nr:hypothetical protein [Bacillus sp. RO2]MEA3321158.1 hypothetical protein [Bacillota bacterium]NMH74216.1 hypothetical protein [Bacillus sp. RO2]